MKLNDSKNIFIYIVLIAFYHFSIQNPLEKYFFKCHFDYFNIKRPLKICTNEYKHVNPIVCVGMPSGHAETITIIISLLYLYKFIPLWLSLLVIFLIYIQRYTSNMHSISQIVAGILVGLFYVFIYKHFNLSILSFLIIFGIGIALYVSCLNDIKNLH